MGSLLVYGGNNAAKTGSWGYLNKYSKHDPAIFEKCRIIYFYFIICDRPYSIVEKGIEDY